jgi:hypothetical protein
MSKKQTILTNIQNGIDKIKNNESKIVFFVQDSKGTAKASVMTMYQHAQTLRELGYEAVILTEREDYIKPGVWMGTEYDEIPHFSVEKNALTIGPADFLVIPEIYGNIVEQVERLPMEKIVLVQQYEHMLDTYAPGKSWYHYGAHETITTSPTLKKAIEETLRVNNVTVVPIAIGDHFTPATTPQVPVIAIHSRDIKKATKIIKQFYLKYPLFKFVSFKDMHNMTNKDFAVQLKECCLAIWLDDNSSFGTFPVEAIKCGVPVIGKAPNIIPEWMTDDNGIWLYDENQIVDMMFNYIKGWLEDTLPENYTTVDTQVAGKYTVADMKAAVKEVYEGYIAKRIQKLEAMQEKVKEQPEEEETPEAPAEEAAQ